MLGDARDLERRPDRHRAADARDVPARRRHARATPRGWSTPALDRRRRGGGAAARSWTTAASRSRCAAAATASTSSDRAQARRRRPPERRRLRSDRRARRAAARARRGARRELAGAGDGMRRRPAAGRQGERLHLARRRAAGAPAHRAEEDRPLRHARSRRHRPPAADARAGDAPHPLPDPGAQGLRGDDPLRRRRPTPTTPRARSTERSLDRRASPPSGWRRRCARSRATFEQNAAPLLRHARSRASSSTSWRAAARRCRRRPRRCTVVRASRPPASSRATSSRFRLTCSLRHLRPQPRPRPRPPARHGAHLAACAAPQIGALRRRAGGHGLGEVEAAFEPEPDSAWRWIPFDADPAAVRGDPHRRPAGAPHHPRPDRPGRATPRIDEGDWVKLVNRPAEFVAVGTVVERIGERRRAASSSPGSSSSRPRPMWSACF